MYIGLKCQIYCKETHLSLPYGAGCDTGKLTSMALVDAFIVLRRSDAFFSRTWIGKETSTVGVFFLRYRRKRYLGFVEGIVAPYKGELAFKRSSRRVARGETPPQGTRVLYHQPTSKLDRQHNRRIFDLLPSIASSQSFRFRPSAYI